MAGRDPYTPSGCGGPATFSLMEPEPEPEPKQKAYYGQGGQQGQEIKDRRDRAVYDRQTFLMSFAKEDMRGVFT